MAFDLQAWKESAAGKLKNLGNGLKRRAAADVPYLAYGALCGATLLPAVEAARSGQFVPVAVAIGSVAAGIGGNLIAEQILRWKDGADAIGADELAQWAADHAGNPDVRAALDAILEKLDAIPQAQAALADADRQWFTATLRGELAGLGSLPRFEAVLIGSGAIAMDHSVAAGVDGIAIGGDVRGPLVKAETYIAKQEVHPPAPSPEERAEARYLKRLAQRCNVLPLAALGGDEEAADEVGLDRVYINLDTRTRVPLSDQEKAQRRALPGREEDRALTALEATAQNRRLVLLGEPGSGKSTFVRQLSVWLAEGRPPAGWEPGLAPVLTTLRDLAPRLSTLALDGLPEDEGDRRLAGAVWEQWRADLRSLGADEYAAHLEDALTDGQAALIFDGLDEVPEGVRRRVREAVRAILRAYPRVPRVIVTCRIRSYAGAAVLPNFAAHTLAPFDQDKIGRFVQAWYRAQVDLGRVDKQQAEARAGDLRQAALSSDLRELSSNPMLLTTMAIIHQREVGLPRERVRLYSLAVQVLISRWQKRKAVAVSDSLSAVLGDDLKLRAILERLGYEAHHLQSARGREADLSRKDILALLEDPQLLDEAGLASEFLDYVDQRAGLLIGHGGDEDGRKPQTYTFPHRTFQEYLAGCCMVSGRGAAREYWKRAEEGDFWYLAARLGAEELLYNRRSAKDVLDLAYDLCPAPEPARPVEWRAALWSGQMAALLGADSIARDAERPEGGRAYVGRLAPRLVSALWGEALGPIERAEAGRALARIGDPRPEVMMVDAMQFCYVPPGPFWMGSEEEEQFIIGSEKPVHKVNLQQGYWIARFPVTVAQFKTFIEEGGYGQRQYWVEANRAGRWDNGLVKRSVVREVEGQYRVVDETSDAPADFGEAFALPNQPVVGVCWWEALAFTRWLGDRWRKAERLPRNWRVRLPSEREWEKAARGGLSVSQSTVAGWPANDPAVTLEDNPRPRRRYPWGDDADPNRANYAETGVESTSALGCFPHGASPYGCEDMSGNVWEWCATKWQESYAKYKDDNDPQGEDTRVMRGGAFFDNQWDVRCAVRFGSAPYGGFTSLGFRVVASPF